MSMRTMLSFGAICQEIPGLTEAELTMFVGAAWVCPSVRQGETVFSDADLARIRLIQDLRQLRVEEETLPLVLSLLDQLYATRRALRRAIEAAGPAVAERLSKSLMDGE